MYEPYKSKEELYFSFYLEELQKAGYIDSWGYETHKFELTKPYSRKYLKQMKTKVKKEEEFLLHGSSITADFTINWTNIACNIFYLCDVLQIKNLKNIPFRLAGKWHNLISHIEIKPINESNTSSSISFPYKQKFCLDKHGIYIQKIVPFDTKKKCLFSQTFTPKKVIECEIYKKDCAGGKKGESKLKYKVKTLKEFIDEQNTK